MNIHIKDFGEDFSWGVSTAAYQIEGAYDLHGKGLSVWDTFVRKKRKILNNESGDEACDFYNRFTGDIALLYQLNIPNFRFSISWSRIFPDGTGDINYKGIDFYNRVIDFCLELGITPWVTIYHWDLPQTLQDKGGWVNREIIEWFSDFVECCVKNFGDRVKHWMVLNEPLVFTGTGYFLGIHAPGKKGMMNFLAAAHHAAICQAQGGRIIKDFQPHVKIGTTISCSHIETDIPTEKNILAAQRVDALANRFFIEPLLGLGYPVKELTFLTRMEKFIKQGDEQKLCFDMDFIGIQNYTREIIRHNYFIPYIHAKNINAEKRNVETTLMNWEVYPPSIYQMLKKFGAYQGIKEIIVTENGAAFEDSIENGVIHDHKRTRYLKDHIEQVYKAKSEGVNVKGYFVWTLLDNFEWAQGYQPRFGLVYVHFNSQKRVIKSSGYWYRNFLCGINSCAAL